MPHIPFATTGAAMIAIRARSGDNRGMNEPGRMSKSNDRDNDYRREVA